MRILNIAGINVSSYTMWYRYTNSLSQKIFLVNNERVSPQDKISYVCPCCKKEATTSLRTFNDRIGTYETFDYCCSNCVKSNKHLSKKSVLLKYKNSKAKERKTRIKNNTTMKQLIKNGRKIGFVGLDISSGSKIRTKMNETKKKNNSNTNKGTNAYLKRKETYAKKTKIELDEIKNKQYITKEINGSSAKHKSKKGEEFGFVNCSEEKRNQINVKTKKTLNSIEENGKSLMYNVVTAKNKRMRAAGRMTKLEDLQDFDRYKKAVWKVTNSQKLYLLENYDKRGRADLKEDAYHLDHKFSIKAAFELSIPAYIIGNIANLEMIHHSENCSKQSNCSMSLKDLYDACHH